MQIKIILKRIICQFSPFALAAGGILQWLLSLDSQFVGSLSWPDSDSESLMSDYPCSVQE